MHQPLTGKTILITGATDGLGKLVATHLAAQGARLLLHGRNIEKGRSVLNELKSKTGNQQLCYYNADLSSLDDVSDMCNRILTAQKHIDIIINNAGMGTFKREHSQNGIELTMAVNYVAQVLLTEKLLPAVPNPGKIINVASASQEPLHFPNFMMEKYFDGYSAYCKSKTALLMYTMDLAERLKANGITVNALHPATLMNTKMVQKNFVSSTVEEGAAAVEALLNVEETGNYYNGKRLSKAIHQVYDAESRSKLQELTNTILKTYLN